MLTRPDGIIHHKLYIIHTNLVGTWRATLIPPFVILRSVSDEDVLLNEVKNLLSQRSRNRGCIQILHFAQDDRMGGAGCLHLEWG